MLSLYVFWCVTLNEAHSPSKVTSNKVSAEAQATKTEATKIASLIFFDLSNLVGVFFIDFKLLRNATYIVKNICEKFDEYFII